MGEIFGVAMRKWENGKWLRILRIALERIL